MGVTYNSIETDTQALVYGILNSNMTTSCKVLDGRPQGLMTLTGFPYVLVHSPERGQEKMLTNKLRMIPITIIVEIFVRDKESLVRTLTGEALGLLESHQQTTRNGKNFKYKTNSTNLNITPIAGQDAKTIFQMTCTISYEVTAFDTA